MTIRGVLFDCDGVLVDSEAPGLDETVVYLRGHGFSFDRVDLVRRFTGMRSDHFRRAMGAAYSDILGRAPSEAEVHTLFEGILNIRRARRHLVELVPGAAQSLRAVRTHPAEMALAIASSSAQEFLDNKMDRYNLRPIVGAHVYSADHVAHGKPAPDIFLYAAQKIDIPIAECLIIEDSAHGVDAGISAGAQVWGFVGGGHCVEDHGEKLLSHGASRILCDHVELTQSLLAL